MSDNDLRQFGKWMTTYNFDRFALNEDTTAHADQLQQVLLSELDKLCPLKTMRVNKDDKPFINQELKSLKRRKMREYIKRGKSAKYRKLAKEFENKFKAAAQRYLRGKIDDLKDTQPGKAYNVLRSMGAKPGDSVDGNQFTLPTHMGLTNKESAELIAQHFAAISHEYSPLKASDLPQYVKYRMDDGIQP